MTRTRKARNDRNHCIYVITNTVTNEYYIGLTAISFNGSVNRTLHRRMQKHMQRAITENKDWGLSKNLREFGSVSFQYGPLEIVRGKKEAHSRETALIKQFSPALNTFK